MPFLGLKRIVALVIVSVLFSTVSFLVWTEVDHENRAGEAKEAIIEVLEGNNRSVHPTLYGLSKSEESLDWTFCWLCWYVITENETVWYESLPNQYTFWFWDANHTAHYFDVWEYTKIGVV